MNACEATLSITALANAIAQNFDDDQLALLGAAFTQLGDTLATISLLRALCKQQCKEACENAKASRTQNNGEAEPKPDANADGSPEKQRPDKGRDAP